MKRLILLAALVGAATVARSEETPQGPPAGPPAHVFFSPSGEPFRPTPTARDTFAAWFDRADANHDGKIDRTEFRADAMAFFKVLDANGDGGVDGFEVNAYEHKIAPELIAEVETRAFGPARGERGEGAGSQSSGDGGGGHGGRGRGGGGRAGREPSAEEFHGTSGRGHIALLYDPEPVSSADTNIDGRVSAAEWLATSDRRFDALDDQQTGVLTREALQAMLPRPPKPGKRR